MYLFLMEVSMNKQELEDLIKSYSTRKDMYELKKGEEEAENVFVMHNTIFLSPTKMQIKKLDGTIEKYNIEKYYPIDERDEKIKELNKKVEELERRIYEYSSTNEPTTNGDKPSTNDDGVTQS